MKGFWEWFKASTKMKRWMFLVVIGIVLTCYGLAEVLVMKELSFSEVAQIVGIFVVGFACIVIGIVFMQKRTLEVLIEASDDRMGNRKEVNMNSLIFNKKIYSEGPKVVVIGGGTGLNTVLQGMKNYTSNITAVVAVTDYGKIPSSSRRELQVLPLEDIKDSMIALSHDETEMNHLFNYKFQKGRLESLMFSDIYFSAMSQISSDFSTSVQEASKIFNLTGKVLPVTLDEMKICAELSDGTIVEEKEKIPQVVSSKISKIERIYIQPTNCKMAPGVKEAIEEADCIIIGPGSLYTNVIPTLLVNGVSKAIKETKAMKVYISNIMTEPGQTDNYGVSDHINAILDHCGQDILDFCIYDTGEIIPEFIKKYNQDGADLVEQDVQKVKNKNVHLLQRNLSDISAEHIRHHSDAVAAAIIEIICDDLKFKDKQKDPQYVMLNAKLKHEKKMKKIPQVKDSQKEKKTKSKHLGRKPSKFSEMYGDRMKSIKNSERQTQESRKKIEEKRAQRTKNTKNAKKKSTAAKTKTTNKKQKK